MATCALFIDYENVIKSLRGKNISATHKQLAEIFRSEATKYGEVVYARAYAPWDIFPEAMSVFDRHDIKPEYVEGGRKDNADLVMSLDIQQQFLRIPGRNADVFILVTGDGDFMHVIRQLQEEQKRVVIWGVEGSISSRLAARAAEVVNIQELLAQHGVGMAALAQAIPMARTASGALQQDSAVRALIVRSESVMLTRGWVQVPFLTLMQEMSNSSLFGEDSEQRRLLIVRCLEDGVLETKKQPNPKRPGTDTTFILLKKEHQTVADTLHFVQSVVANMRSLLSGMSGATWVAFDLLEKSLASDAHLGTQSDTERRAWLDLCLAEGLLRMEKRENPKNPEVPASALYLNEEHPLVQQVVPGEDLTPLLRRLVIIMDHYLIRTGYAWMSMGLLRQNLGVYGQTEMERCIRRANEDGVLVIRQQPNQFGSRPTTGAYLLAEHSFVVESLEMRDTLLDALFQSFSRQEVLSRAVIMDVLRDSMRGTDEDRTHMLDLMISQQIISPALSPEGAEGLTLQRKHPVNVRWQESSMVQ